MVNIVTSIRVVCSIALLVYPVFSPVFYVLYIFAGASDMIDDIVARKTETVSELGLKLDTGADFNRLVSEAYLETVRRTIVVAVKLLPLLS